ncbi:endonuclease MutS2, partial [bacterium]|nr:endonuclease MutS2 [bacterium]
LSLIVKSSNLRPSKKKQEEKPKSTYKVESIQVPVELNLIGKRVDEALSMLDKYLDDVLRPHLKSVRIIHGYGTGALKKAVYAYLKDCKYVKDYHHAGAYDGGMGATIVVLKD